MQFAQPLWIVTGLFICLAVYLLSLRLQKIRNNALQSFAAKTLMGKLTVSVSTRKRKIKFILLIAGIFACFVALARPQYGHHWIDVKRKGIDILFAIDTSTSMLAEDIRPNRLERSKFAVLDFIHQLEGDRVGLMPFAGTAFLMCPLTVDYSAFEQSLQAINTDIIPEPGTNIAEAISSAESILHNNANHKLLIIITDGENLQGDAIQAATEAAKKDMTIFTVGVGTSDGELIPIKINGSQGFVKDDSGKFVTSKLDQQSLKEIAEKTMGLYAPLGNKGQGLETIYQQKLVLIPKEELAEKRHKVPIERYPWILGFALILFIIEFLIGGRKSSSQANGLQDWLSRKKPSFFLVIIAATFILQTRSWAFQGEDAFRDNDYLAASEYYEKELEKVPENPILQYNFGATAYKNNLYDNAIESFNKALKTDDLLLQEKAYYNLGNAQFKKGEESLQADPKKTMAHWQDALTAYTSCLQLQPDNADARFNHDLVEKKLKDLEQQQQQQQQQDSPDNQQKKEKSKQENDQNGRQQQDMEQGNPAESEDIENKEPDKDKLPQTGPDTAQEEEQNKEGQTQADASKIETGELSKQEAEQLLDEMKNEEGTLNFVPTQKRKTDKSLGRNW